MYQFSFILEWHSACFGRSFRPSSGVQDCTYSNRHMSNRYCCLPASGYEMELIPASKQTVVSVWHMPVAVCTVLNSSWWTERPSETCRVLFQNKIIWYIDVSGWFYYRNILPCTALWASKIFSCFLLVNSPASEFYIPTFLNTLSLLSS